MPVHVLLIGDDVESRARTAADLTAAGHFCEVAPPSDSVSLLAARRFELIMLEEAEADRVGLVEELRAAVGAEPVIVAVSAPGRREPLLRAGADATFDPTRGTMEETVSAAEQLLRARQGPLSLTHAVAMMSASLAAGFDDPDAIRRALIPLAEAGDLDRILAMDHRPGDDVWRGHFIWTRDGFVPPAAHPIDYVIEDWGLAEWTDALDAGRAVDARKGETTGPVRRLFEERDIASTYIVPAGWDGDRWTAVVFVDTGVERHWSQEEQDAFTTAAVALEGALRWSNYRLRLMESEARLRSYLDTLPDTIVTMDREGTYLDNVVSASHETLQMRAGTNVRGALPEPYASERLRLIAEVLDTGEMRTQEYEVALGDQYFYQEARVLPHADDTVMLVTRDVTAERRLGARASQLAHILDHSKAGVLIVDAESYLILDSNETARANLGYSAEELARLTPFDLKPDMTAGGFEVMAQSLRVGDTGIGRFEAYLTRKDGSTYLSDLTVEYFPGERPPVFVAYVEDITEQAATKSTVERLARIVEGSIVEINVFDAETLRVVGLNRAARENLGWREDEVTGLTADQISVSSTIEELRTAIEPLVAGEVDRLQMEGTARRKDGSTYPTETTMQYYPGETPPLLVASVRDVSEQRAAQSAAERMGRILDRSVAEVAVIDAATLRIVDTNAATRRNLGYTAEELATMTPIDVKPEMNADRLAEIVAPLLAGEAEVVHFETDHERKDGTRYPVEVALEYYDDEDPPIFVAYVEDVTARRTAVAQAERLGRIVDQSTSEVYISERDTLRVIQVSQQVVANTGYSADELLGMSADELMIGLDAAGADGISGTQVFDGLRIQRKDGSEYLLAGTVELEDEEDPPVLVVIGQDVTERAQQEEAMLQTAKLESLGQLAGGIAHDFNNLLVGILGNASMATDALPAGSPLVPLLDEIELAGNRAADLSRELLTYAGGGQVEIEIVDVNLVVREMTSLLRLVDGALSFALQPDLPPVQADPTQVRQLVMNLVQNAADAVAEMDVPGTIRVATGLTEFQRSRNSVAFPGERVARGSYITIEVADDGPGIPSGVRQRIFDPFFTTKAAGHGFGLATVLGIVRNHGGDIRVSSRPGRGATFTVYLPAAAPGSISVDTDSSQPAEEAAVEGRILVIDDDAMVRSVLVRAMASFGAEVDQAADGEEGLAAFEGAGRHGYLCIFVDLSMPRIDGVETVRRIREVDTETKIVLMSGYAEEDARARLPGVKVSGFLQKPFDLARLREMMSGF